MRFDDKELIKAINELKSGNAEAFEIIYKLTYKKVYFLSLSITKNEEMSKDIIQEVYISILKNISSLKDDRFFIGWLNKITYNATMKELRKKNKVETTYADEDLYCEPIDDCDPLSQYLEDEAAKEIIASIMELKEIYRTVFILKHFNNYKIKEISEVIGCPEGTVKSRLNKAKELLKDKLSKKYSRVGSIIFFSILMSSTLTKAANAAVRDENIANIKNSNNLRHIFKLTKGVVLTGSTVLVGATIISNYSNSTIHVDSYIKELTNKSIEINVVVSGGYKSNQIKILKDNGPIDFNKKNSKEFSFSANENGTYEIIVNEDVREVINIENIDKGDPVIREYNIIGEQIELILEDNLSGINYDKIKISSIDNTEIKPLKIDSEKNTIYFKLVQGKINIEIEDNVNNKAIYEIEINVE